MPKNGFLGMLAVQKSRDAALGAIKPPVASRRKLVAAMTHPTTPRLNPGVSTTRRRLGAAMALASLVLVACDSPPADSPMEAVQQRLVGSWLRDYEQDGVRVRRLLVLEADGHFSETARVVDAGGAVTRHSHAGEWTFDGTNLKRRYTRFDGKQPSAPTLPYATFQLRFESNREFVGTDNLRKREVRYQRVEPGAAL